MTTQASTNEPMDVYLEVGQKRVFACAVEWPGWCRSGKTEDQALDALVAYSGRYALVAQEAGVSFPQTRRDALRVVERLAGSAGYTDFGAPGAVCTRDREPLTHEEATRHAALLRASWAVFDRIAAAAPAELRKGPRGGGRDRDQLIDHVLAAEAAYARKIGIALRPPAHHDSPAIATLRDAVTVVLRLPSDGSPAVPPGWPPRYAARRIAWHLLDHAWEMEDRGDLTR